jgi:predicted Zn finger-like uncharacterized protein
VGKKRPERTQRREQERAVKKLVHVKERLATMVPGGSKDHPIQVSASPQVEIRVHGMTCPQCEGRYAIVDHRSAGQGIRPVDVKCNVCGVARTLWFRIVEDQPN